jgi:hypothetical protein
MLSSGLRLRSQRPVSAICIVVVTSGTVTAMNLNEWKRSCALSEEVSCSASDYKAVHELSCKVTRAAGTETTRFSKAFTISHRIVHVINKGLITAVLDPCTGEFQQSLAHVRRYITRSTHISFPDTPHVVVASSRDTACS